MPRRPSSFGRAFLPGPVEVRREVLEAMLRPMLPPWSDEGAALLAGLQAPLRRLFRTERPVLLTASTSTGLCEAAIRNAVAGRLLVLSGGFFGERFARVAEGCGREVVQVQAPAGGTVEPEELARALDEAPVDAVALVHSETSTGALCDLAALARVVRARSDALILVDAVTSVGALPVETDAWGLDFVFTGTQKALAAPPGLALGVASARFLERAARVSARGWYFDLLKYDQVARTSSPMQTPALSLLYALECQLARIEEAGGVEARWARHRKLFGIMEQWVAARAGVEFLAPEGQRSWSVSALTLPPGVSVPDTLRRMRQRGWLLTGGLDGLADRVVRVGHMGDVEAPALSAMLDELASVV
jgi:aspartate aminotransferase-like enzyme